MTVYVSKSSDGNGIILIPVATEPEMSVDARWPLAPGETFGGLTFEQIAEASELLVDENGNAAIVGGGS